MHRLLQLPIDRAADAAVAELHHLITGGHHELVVDPHLTEFIDQHGAAQPLLVAEDVVKQGGLTSAEEAGEQGDGHLRLGLLRWRDHDRDTD